MAKSLVELSKNWYRLDLLFRQGIYDEPFWKLLISKEARATKREKHRFLREKEQQINTVSLAITYASLIFKTQGDSISDQFISDGFSLAKKAVKMDPDFFKTNQQNDSVTKVIHLLTIALEHECNITSLQPLLQTLRTNKDPQARLIALKSLTKFDNEGIVIPLMVSMVYDPDTEVNKAAGEALGILKGAAAEMNQAIKDLPLAKILATATLPELEGSVAVSKELSDEDKVAAMKSNKDVLALIEALRDDKLMGYAGKALIDMEINLTRTPLIQALKDDNIAICRTAIMALAGRGGEEANEAIRQIALHHNDKGTRDLANWALNG